MNLLMASQPTIEVQNIRAKILRESNSDSRLSTFFRMRR